MMQSMLLDIFDWISGFFMALFDFIPKLVYLIYASVACILDVFQLLFRKLAGLDVYYMTNPSTGATEAVTGDIVTNFISGILGINSNGFTYSALSTVFWAMVLFGVIITFGTTIIAIIKSHYSYDAKSGGPLQFIYQGGKALINIAAVPIVILLGLFVTEALLKAVDSITSTTSSVVDSQFGTYQDTEFTDDGQQIVVDRSVAARYFLSTRTSRSSDTQEERTYIYYDIFGISSDVLYGNVANAAFMQDDASRAKIAATNTTFSGTLFKAAAYSANRVRQGHFSIVNTADGRDQFTGGPNDETLPIFQNAKTDEELADMIDTLFASNIHLKLQNSSSGSGLMGNGYWLDYGGAMAPYISLNYFNTFLTRTFTSFSKFNIGLVWYYYNLWAFNFVVGFGAVLICVVLFINIILGLMTRLFMSVGLFLIAPPVFGLAPLTDKPKKGWTETFVKQILMVFGAVIGMNVFFLLFPYINRIKFFDMALLDYIIQTLFIITGLITVKAFIAAVSALVGGENAATTGENVGKEIGKIAGKATAMTVGAAAIPYRMARGAMTQQNLATARAHEAAEQTELHNAQAALQVHERDRQQMTDYQRKMQLFNAAYDINSGIRSGRKIDRAAFMAEAQRLGIDSAQAANMYSSAQSYLRSHGVAGSSAATFAGQYKSDHGTTGDHSDDTFATMHGTYGSLVAGSIGLARFNADMATTQSNINAQQARVVNRTRRYNQWHAARENAEEERRVRGNEITAALRQPFTFVHDTLRSHDAVTDFEHDSGIKRRHDYARENAENSAATNAALRGMQEQIDRIERNLRH